MSTVVFDIETAGRDFDELDEISQESLLKKAETDEEVAQVKSSLGLYPLTGQIVTIAMGEVDSDKAFVFYQDKTSKEGQFKEGPVTFRKGSEKDILMNFWNTIKKYSQFVTFNGRGFDCPYIIVRSAIHRIKPTRQLMPYRYDHKTHIDLADQLSFYGAVRRPFSLHMWCQAFGIESPKEAGVTGEQVTDLFEQDGAQEIARYCLNDVRATTELYGYWRDYVRT